jgi:flagellar basal body rod protein FlgB
MVKLAQNTIWHTALIQILTSRLSMMKAAVRERG